MLVPLLKLIYLCKKFLKTIHLFNKYLMKEQKETQSKKKGDNLWKGHHYRPKGPDPRE